MIVSASTLTGMTVKFVNVYQDAEVSETPAPEPEPVKRKRPAKKTASAN
jgi:hypothetical protein